MKLNKMPKTSNKKKKRVGRGYGSGKGGHTAGRGQKGQKSRSKVGLLFEGTKMRKSLIRRLPMMRGKSKFKSFKLKPIEVNVKYLNLLKDGSQVTVKSLIKAGIVDKLAENLGVKILGEGKLKKKLEVLLPVSKGAEKKIKKAGGKIGEEKKAKPEVKTKDKKQTEVIKKVKLAKSGKKTAKADQKTKSAKAKKSAQKTSSKSTKTKTKSAKKA
jgi:large subunit ribosomal protein L15